MTENGRREVKFWAMIALTLISIIGIISGVIVAYFQSPIGGIITVVTGAIGGIVAIVLRDMDKP